MTNSSEVDVNCLTFYFNDVTVNIGVFLFFFVFFFFLVLSWKYLGWKYFKIFWGKLFQILGPHICICLDPIYVHDLILPRHLSCLSIYFVTLLVEVLASEDEQAAWILWMSFPVSCWHLYWNLNQMTLLIHVVTFTYLYLCREKKLYMLLVTWTPHVRAAVNDTESNGMYNSNSHSSVDFVFFS